MTAVLPATRTHHSKPCRAVHRGALPRSMGVTIVHFQSRKPISLGYADPPGTIGDEQADDSESVARWLAAFNAIPPLAMSPEEEAAWRAARAEQKRIDTARIERLAAGFSGAAG
jgi:hypothetical protein